MMLHTGMGSYPEDLCYDPRRTSWLPYWLNTDKEQACVIASIKAMDKPVSGSSLYNPNLVMAPIAPSTVEELAPGAWTPEGYRAAQAAQAERLNALNRQSISYERVVGREFEAENAPVSTLAQWWEKNKWFVLGAGMGVLAVTQITRR